MKQDYQILREDFAALGLRPGDSVLIHSSYKSMGAVEGGIETVVSALRSVIGDAGTLIAPTLTFSYVTAENPVFDYVNTPSCVGAISEFVRHMPGSIRSVHPTHSCAAIGAKAEYYTGSHGLDRTPVGENSPFFKLMEDGGKILMLGCRVGANTSMHGVEERFGVWYLLPEKPSPYTVILPEKTYDIAFYRHHIMQNGFRQRYDRVADIIDARYMRRGTVHGADSVLFDAPGLWKTGLKALSQNELFFVDRLEQNNTTA